MIVFSGIDFFFFLRLIFFKIATNRINRIIYILKCYFLIMKKIIHATDGNNKIIVAILNNTIRFFKFDKFGGCYVMKIENNKILSHWLNDFYYYPRNLIDQRIDTNHIIIKYDSNSEYEHTVKINLKTNNIKIITMDKIIFNYE